jgi:hypothetical protein
LATHLCLVREEELVRVHAICDGAAENGEPVEDERGLIRVLAQQLLQDIEHDGQDDKGGSAGRNKDGEGGGRGEVGQWPGYLGDEAHDVQKSRAKRTGGVVEECGRELRVLIINLGSCDAPATR